VAQVVIGVAGAAVGFLVGGPQGAAVGFSVGMSVGSLLFGSGASAIGNTLGDIATQTAKEGVARPIIWGRVRPVAGNLIACSDPKIVKKKTKSGKGGGGQSTTTESVYRTYAIRVCEGPITRYTRIWRNNELVYDGRVINSGAGTASAATTPTLADGIVNVSDSATTDWGNENNAEFLKNGRLYLGSWDQMPDSSLEGIFGAGNVPPHRGTAYMVMDNELLNDTGGAVPQWVFEVERCEGFILTSHPYAVEAGDSLGTDGLSNVVGRYQNVTYGISSSIDANSPSVYSVTLASKLKSYSQSNESINATAVSVVYISLGAALKSTKQNPESLNGTSPFIVDVSLSANLVTTQSESQNLNGNAPSIIGVILG